MPSASTPYGKTTNGPIMKFRTIIYLTAALAAAGAAASCEHNDVFEELEFAVTLSPQNTYLAGQPVVFDFRGNPDYITVWNGDTGHAYRNRERTLAPEAFRSATLEIEMSQQYGYPGLEIYLTDRFEGLSGRVHGDTNAHAEADRARIEEVVASGFEGWTRFAFDEKNEAAFHTFTAEVSQLKEHFTMAIRIRTPEGGRQVRTYYLNPRLRVEFADYGTRTWRYPELGFVPFRTEGLYTDHTPYVCSVQEDFDAFLRVNQNGIVKFGDGLNPVSGADIAFQGFRPGDAVNGTTYEAVDQWIISKPMKLYTLEPDTGQNIKGVTDNLRSYEHVYDKAGTYTATFIVSTGNYAGQSAREIREVTFTIVEPLGQP